MQAVGVVHRQTLAPAVGGSADAQPVAHRAVHFDGGSVETPVYERDTLGAGAQIVGPAIVEEFGSTTVAFPAWHVGVDDYGNLILTKDRGEA